MATNPDAGHPGNDYYVSPTGTIQQQSNPALAVALQAAGYSGPYDWAGAKAAANSGPFAGLSGMFANFTAPFQDIAKVFGDLTNPNTWIRLAKIVVGGALVLLGVAQLTHAPAAVKSAAKTVKKAAEVAAIA